MVSGPLEHHQMLGIVYGQRSQQDGIHQAEDGRVGADAESEGEHGNASEAGRFAEHAESEAEVLQQGVEEGQAAAFAVDFSGLLEAAKVEQRLAAGLLAA